MANKSFADVQEFLKGKVILVANRGIPARRICRSIRERFDAVAAMTATDVDKTAPSASTAKELILLGPDPRAYLDIDRIIDKARQRGVVGIHPGWGFASEDTRFPQRCKEAGITFIGATAEAMNLLGNKVQARAVARKLGIPVVPGSDGAVDIATARQLISEIGLPIISKLCASLCDLCPDQRLIHSLPQMCYLLSRTQRIAGFYNHICLQPFFCRQKDICIGGR